MNKTRQKLALPRTIRIGKQRYSVDVVETMLNKGDMARVFYDKRKIQLAKRSNSTGRKYTRKEMNDSFWHELVHAILRDMEEHKLNKREEFVEGFAKRLSIAINTARFS